MTQPTDAEPGRGRTEPHQVKTPGAVSGQLTVKQQRDAKRSGKIAKARGQEAKVKRNRSARLVGGGIAVVVAISLIVFNATSGKEKAALTSEDVQTFTGITASHTGGIVNYPQTPPVGGAHAQAWLNCGVYASPVPNENAVHSLEHGAVWVTYDPTAITGEQLTTLRKAIPKTHAILSPYQGLPSPIVASAWGAQLKVSLVSDPRITEFISKYRGANSAPEPGAPCTGGIDGPDKIS